MLYTHLSFIIIYKSAVQYSVIFHTQRHWAGEHYALLSLSSWRGSILYAMQRKESTQHISRSDEPESHYAHHHHLPELLMKRHIAFSKEWKAAVICHLFSRQACHDWHYHVLLRKSHHYCFFTLTLSSLRAESGYADERRVASRW